MRVLWGVLLLGACAKAPERPDPDTIVVSLDAHGVIRWRGKQMTLERLAVVLRNIEDRYDLKQRRLYQQGCFGCARFEKPPLPVSVVLHVDGDAPWRHVQWLVAICVGRRFEEIVIDPVVLRA